MTAHAKFCFRGIWYPFEQVRKAACDAARVKEDMIEDEEDLDILVNAIIKGAPSPCANFIVALNEGITS